jgi:hypothetical protein
MTLTEEQKNEQLMNLLKDLNDHEDEQFEKYPDLDPATFVFALLMQATVLHRCEFEDADFKTLVDRLSASWALFDAFEKDQEEENE